VLIGDRCATLGSRASTPAVAGQRIDLTEPTHHLIE
jgi:hypothetical protein